MINNQLRYDVTMKAFLDSVYSESSRGDLERSLISLHRMVFFLAARELYSLTLLTCLRLANLT